MGELFLVMLSAIRKRLVCDVYCNKKWSKKREDFCIESSMF